MPSHVEQRIVARSIGFTVVLILSLAILAPPASAAINDRVRKACIADYKRLCPSYKVGSPQLRTCMEAKSGDISGPCMNALIDAGEVDSRRLSSRR